MHWRGAHFGTACRGCSSNGGRRYLLAGDQGRGRGGRAGVAFCPICDLSAAACEVPDALPPGAAAAWRHYCAQQLP